MRREPADESEMISQVLFGEHFKVVEERKKWSKIRLAWDGYEGWIDRKQWVEIIKTKYDQCDKKSAFNCSLELVSIVELESLNVVQPILLGSTLPDLQDSEFALGHVKGKFEGTFFEGVSKEKSRLIENAYMFLNAPYLWGGRATFGIDCSGFTQLVYKMNGIKLPRDAYQQADIGLTLSFVEESEPGDLAFFDNEEGRIIHVGILLENNYIVHASGKVRIDKIDHQGIFNVDTKRYTHKLRLIKRIIG